MHSKGFRMNINYCATTTRLHLAKVFNALAEQNHPHIKIEISENNGHPFSLMLNKKKLTFQEVCGFVKVTGPCEKKLWQYFEKSSEKTGEDPTFMIINFDDDIFIHRIGSVFFMNESHLRIEFPKDKAPAAIALVLKSFFDLYGKGLTFDEHTNYAIHKPEKKLEIF